MNSGFIISLIAVIITALAGIAFIAVIDWILH